MGYHYQLSYYKIIFFSVFIRLIKFSKYKSCISDLNIIYLSISLSNILLNISTFHITLFNEDIKRIINQPESNSEN